MSDDLVSKAWSLAVEVDRLNVALTEARAEIERLTGERDDALEQVEELERNAEIVSDEFEKDCWKAMRQLLECCKFDWRDVDRGEGVTADRAYEYIKDTIDAIEADGNRARDRAAAAESELSTLRARVREVVGLGLDVISEERGWGTYPRMEGSEIYTDADVFSRAARQLNEDLK